MLSFQAKAFVLFKARPGACRTAEMIARIELHARLRGEDFNHPTAKWVQQLWQRSHATSGAVHYKAVVIAFGFAATVRLRSPILLRLTEVERCAFNAGELSCRYQRVVYDR